MPKCDRCPEPAKVHVTVVTDGAVEELLLCEAHAKEAGAAATAPPAHDDRPGVKCELCSEAASVHVTEEVDGVPRESHYCRAHADEAGSPALPVVDACLEVTASQLERPEDVAIRFSDSFEISLRDLWRSTARGREEMFRRVLGGSEPRLRDVVEWLCDMNGRAELDHVWRGKRHIVRVELVPETPEVDS